jgi:DNA polymerase-3 subunit delta
MDALELLKPSAKLQPQPVYVLLGDEDFLKRQARERLLNLVLEDADPDFALMVYGSEKPEFSTLRNDLETFPFLAPCRVVVLENADTFVTANRQELENYIARPSSVGVLILEVKTFPENTRLAKALPDAAKIACKPVSQYKVLPWATSWAKSRYDKTLARDAAGLLIERVGNSLGVIDQELGKLASAVVGKAAITAEDVDRLVGRSKGADVFAIMEAIGNGDPRTALSILEELFREGVEPMGVLAPLTHQLRRLALVGRLVASGLPLGEAMNIAQVPGWENIRVNFEKQLRHLGRRRLEKIPDWLYELSFGLKGGSALPERVQVERFIVQLARPREDAIR